MLPVPAAGAGAGTPSAMGATTTPAIAARRLAIGASSCGRAICSARRPGAARREAGSIRPNVNAAPPRGMIRAANATVNATVGANFGRAKRFAIFMHGDGAFVFMSALYALHRVV
jgi:hypothetical protein